MGDVRCAAGCKMGILNGESCGACGGTGKATLGMPQSQPPEDRKPRVHEGATHEYYEKYRPALDHPRRLICGAPYNAWQCTREPGHEGKHAADERGGVVSGVTW